MKANLWRRTFSRSIQAGLWLVAFSVLTASGCGGSPPPKALPEKAAATPNLHSDPKATPAQTAEKPKTSGKKKKAPLLDLKAVGIGAVVDLSRTPAGALFEAKVLANARLTWVERAQVDKVVGELELQAVFSPEGGRGRVGLGKLLKANLLVMLRTGENPENKTIQHLEIVVCETKRGLRLAGQAVPITGKADTQVGELETILEGALAKLSENITDVCAVPPFLNQDLDFKHDHLKAALARVVEQHLLQRKGVLVVELAEAQAIAREAILSGAETKLERQLPLYFLGAFRNEGKDDQRRLELELKLQRGDMALGTKQKGRVLPKETPKQLGKLADELADKVLAAGAIDEFDPQAEVEQLVDRSRAFERLGNWTESLDMLEAALLLDFDQPALHLRASHVCALLVRQGAQKSYVDPREFVLALNHYRRGLEHLEVGVQPTVNKNPPTLPNHGYLVAPAPSDEFTLARLRINQLKNQKPTSEERTALWSQVKKEEREMYLRLCRVRARAGTGDEWRFLAFAVESLPAEEKYAIMRAMILELKDLPLAKERTIFFAKQWYAFMPDPEFPAFVAELARNPHPEIKAAGEFLKKDRADFLAKRKAQESVLPKKNSNADIALQPVELFLGKKETGKPYALNLRGCLAIGPSLDVMVGNRAVFLMKEKGVVTLAWRSSDLNGHPTRFCYDGRYVWFSVERYFKTPQLFVLDPVDLKTWEFTAEDGLLLVDPKSMPDRNAKQIIDMAPLGPGRVCLAGSFGRAWLAIATFDPKADKTVKIFHEAREAPEANVPNQWTRTTLAFEPVRMFVLTGAKGARRVLIGRTGTDGGMQQHPLLVDPDNLTVEVMKDTVGTDYLRNAHVQEGSAYYVGHDPINPVAKSQHLIQIVFPGQRKSVMPGFSVGRCVLLNDEVHVVTNRLDWWQGSLAKKQTRSVGVLPSTGQLDFVGLTSHYGVLVNIMEPELRANRLYQVVVAPKKGAE
jgi:hypothetical protein